jgi:hypothetical protein
MERVHGVMGDAVQHGSGSSWHGQRFPMRWPHPWKIFSPRHCANKVCNNKGLREISPPPTLLTMKWFLCLLLVAAGLFVNRQNQVNEALKVELKEARQTVADLKEQLQLRASAPARVAVVPPAPYQAATPAPYQPVTPKPADNQWMWQRSPLDPQAAGPSGRKK